MPEYANFRQHLDAVLRTLDVQQVQKFLIDEKQWNIDALPADPEFSMYLMIAGSPTLQDLHEQARTWMITHGHGDDALAVLGASKKPGAGKGNLRSQNNSVRNGRAGDRSFGSKRKAPPQRRSGPR